LMMKLLPVMESQKTGMAKALISGVHSKYILASFPTRTLGGRGVGMEKHYSEWFESLIGGEIRILERFVIQNELVYITERKDYGGQTVRSCDSDRESE
ncbi:MAG: hypothetical protein IJC48_03175, partial [Clostridia bacterium]|nr:hypothetical protein [Clostridia bacterium]